MRSTSNRKHALRSLVFEIQFHLLRPETEFVLVEALLLFCTVARWKVCV